MAGLVPAIHVFLGDCTTKTWMPATSAGMTMERARQHKSTVAKRIPGKNQGADLTAPHLIPDGISGIADAHPEVPIQWAFGHHRPFGCHR
jgi:hypothetical protein